MQVWVTGARGFIGRHLARELARQGHAVAGLGHGAWPEVERAPWAVGEWLNGEVEPANLDALAARRGLPDAVVHLAGGSAVGPSFAQPAEDWRRSVRATALLAEWLRQRAAAARLVLASSAAVYGAGHDAPIAETAPCRPFSPYGFHKRMAELLLESYACNFGLRVAVVRLFSVYGSGLRKQLLWDACTRLAQGTALLELGGSGSELRDWLHVDDAARLLVLAIGHADETAWTVNGGTGAGAPVSAIADVLVRSWGLDLPVRFSGRSRAGDPQCLIAETTRLAVLGFTPQRAWPQGVADYVDWFRRQHRDPAARE